MDYFLAVPLMYPKRSVSGAVGTRITMTGYVIFAIFMVGFIYPVVSRVRLKVLTMESPSWLHLWKPVTNQIIPFEKEHRSSFLLPLVEALFAFFFQAHVKICVNVVFLPFSGSSCWPPPNTAGGSDHTF